MTEQCTIAGPSGSLAALLDLPDDDSYPLVVMFHGFTGWKEEEHLATLARQLCAAGIGALRYDAPGSGESDGTFADDYRVSNYLESVDNVLDFVRNELGVLPESTALWGHSMGGFIALETACRVDEVAAVCGCQSSTGKPRFTSHAVERWRSTGWADFPNERFERLDLPFDFYVDRQQYNVLGKIDRLTAPLLLIAGTKDDVVPASTVRTIFDAAPEPKQFREFPTGHAYKNDPDQLAQINAATVAFFQKHLDSSRRHRGKETPTPIEGADE